MIKNFCGHKNQSTKIFHGTASTLRGRTAEALEEKSVLGADGIILSTDWACRDFSKFSGAATVKKFGVIPT